MSPKKADVVSLRPENHGFGVGDAVYFTHPDDGLVSGRVIAAGAHGCTVAHNGNPHQILWQDVLGAKERKKHRYKILDMGEDGAIIEGEDGAKKFLRGGLPTDDGADDGGEWKEMFHKALHAIKDEALAKARPGVIREAADIPQIIQMLEAQAGMIQVLQEKVDMVLETIRAGK